MERNGLENVIYNKNVQTRMVWRKPHTARHVLHSVWNNQTFNMLHRAQCTERVGLENVASIIKNVLPWFSLNIGITGLYSPPSKTLKKKNK